MKKYTRAELEKLVTLQTETISSMQALFNTLKPMNEQLECSNNRLKEEICKLKEKLKKRSS